MRISLFDVYVLYLCTHLFTCTHLSIYMYTIYMDTPIYMYTRFACTHMYTSLYLNVHTYVHVHLHVRIFCSAQDARNCTLAVHEQVDCHILILARSRLSFTEITEYKCFRLIKPSHELRYTIE